MCKEKATDSAIPDHFHYFKARRRLTRVLKQTRAQCVKKEMTAKLLREEEQRREHAVAKTQIKGYASIMHDP
jgi:hypothetical protein